jgi:hypothetical protein
VVLLSIQRKKRKKEREKIKNNFVNEVWSQASTEPGF